MKIYVASSWRNDKQPVVVDTLKNAGFEVYDFKNPSDGDNGFHWSEIDPDWEGWDTTTFCHHLLTHPLARAGFRKDMDALIDCDAVVLVLPCGRSAHLELGWALGQGKPGLIWQGRTEPMEPELMYKMGTVCIDLDEVCEELKRSEP